MNEGPRPQSKYGQGINQSLMVTVLIALAIIALIVFIARR